MAYPRPVWSRPGPTEPQPISIVLRPTSVTGTVKLLDPTLAPLWEVPVRHQLFSLRSADVNGDGHAEIVACSWDGLTIIMDADRNAVQFQFTDAVCAFCAGAFAREAGRNEPCLIFVDYEDRITIFYDLQLAAIPSEIFTERFERTIMPEV